MNANETTLNSKSPVLFDRRQFLQASGAAAMSLSASPLAAGHSTKTGTVRIGVITDLHQDHIHDASARLKSFLDAASTRELDALIQMGDFARPIEKNRDVIQTFNNAHSRCLHVIGNHDLDGGTPVDKVVDGWGMAGRYYKYDINGLRVIALDGNDRAKGNDAKYPASIGPEQLEWLKETLRHPGPMLIVSHQPLAGPYCVDNSAEVQTLLSVAADRIVVAMNGHTHIDDVIQIERVHYWHVNSASYFHVGEKFLHETYSRELHEKYPALSKMCPYRDALFCFLEIDTATKSVTVTGRESTWVGKSPSDLSYPSVSDKTVDGQIVPKIRSRKLNA